MQQQELTNATDNWGAPERVALVSSVDGAGKANLIAVGWATRANMAPPVIAIGLGKKSHSCANITATEQFVFAVPGADLAADVLYCGTHSGREVDKFAVTQLTSTAASQVQPPLVTECLSNLECRVIATQDIGDHRMFFGEVVAVWASERQEQRPLLLVGEGASYEVVKADDIFRLGAVRR
jgi:flavin reductase (DIM6/NTAB) family NADH-FMN oxidoreductase RutF